VFPSLTKSDMGSVAFLAYPSQNHREPNRILSRSSEQEQREKRGPRGLAASISTRIKVRLEPIQIKR
jgi:hypothetical protein